MAIKVGGTTVVSDARLIQNTKFCDTARAVTVSGGATSIDLSADDASVYRVAMGASTTITFSNPQQGQSWNMITTNSAGSYTIALIARTMDLCQLKMHLKGILWHAQVKIFF